ncbi:MAG: threonine/serine dehydratase [Woeseiaceae bacterium]|nr:threonine/serine dehydratase [Woeseiaceae bacterium]
MSDSPTPAVDLHAVEEAAARLRDVAVETPLITNHALDAHTGGRVLLKPECLQRTGSFKIRGAYNLMSQLDAAARTSGVVAWSSGNHAQGVAAAGSMLGIRTAIVMPEDAPRAKIENTRRLGGETVLYDRHTGDREQIARALAAERGAALVPSYEHEHIIAGQGTVGLEIVRQLGSAGADQVLIPCSGGGLSSGCAIAIRALSPGTAVYAVEPRDFDDTRRSLEAGRRVSIDTRASSICDALQVATPGRMTFDLNRELLAGGLVVSDDEVREAMRFAFRELKLVVEPGGAVGLAAVLAGRIDCRDRTTVVVLSGGNVDSALFADIQQAD